MYLVVFSLIFVAKGDHMISIPVLVWFQYFIPFKA